MSASSLESAEKSSSASDVVGFSYSGSRTLIDEAGMGGLETRNEVDEDAPRLAHRILARFIGVISSTKTCESGNLPPGCSSSDGGEW